MKLKLAKSSTTVRVFNSMLVAEAIRNAQKATGKKIDDG